MNKKVILGMVLSSVITYSFAQQNDMQDGYDYQATRINAYLENHSEQLNTMVDFNSVAINGILNPTWLCKKVPVELASTIKTDDFCVNDKKYPVISLYKNEITKEQITWRDYLIFPVITKDIEFKDNEDFKKGIRKANSDYEEKFDMILDMYMRMLKFKILDIKSDGFMNKQKPQPDEIVKLNRTNK